MPRQKASVVESAPTAVTTFDTSVREGFRQSIKDSLHNAIDAGDYDLVAALTEFGKRVDNLKPPKGAAAPSVPNGYSDMGDAGDEPAEDGAEV